MTPYWCRAVLITGARGSAHAVVGSRTPLRFDYNVDRFGSRSWRDDHVVTWKFQPQEAGIGAARRFVASALGVGPGRRRPQTQSCSPARW